MKVSIITVCLNEGVNIEKTLRSYAAQTYVNKEMILIDGGSDDDTLNSIALYRDQLAVLVSEKDGGTYDAMNKGVRHVSGDYILFLNGGDEFFSPSSLSSVFQGKRYEEDIIYGDIAIVDEQGEQLVSRNPAKLNTLFLANYNISHQATLYKTSFLRGYGGFSLDYKILSDYAFLVNAVLVDKCRQRHVSVVICSFYHGGISTAARFKSERQAERIRVQKALLPWYIPLYSRVRFGLARTIKRLAPRFLITVGEKAFSKLFRPSGF